MRVDGVGPRRIGRRRQHVRLAARLDDVGRVAAARAFGVVGVDRAALERRDRVFDEARFVQRVGVDRHLHVDLVGHRQAVVDRRRRRAPVLVQLQADRAGLDLLVAAARGRLALPLPRKPRFIGKRFGGLQHALRCATAPACRSSRTVPVAGPVPPPIIVVTPRHQRLVDLLRADEVDVRVDAAGGDDHAFAGDDLGARRRSRWSTPGWMSGLPALPMPRCGRP